MSARPKSKPKGRKHPMKVRMGAPPMLLPLALSERDEARCPVCGLWTTRAQVICDASFAAWRARLEPLNLGVNTQVFLAALESVWRLAGLDAAVTWLDGEGLGHVADMRSRYFPVRDLEPAPDPTSATYRQLLPLGPRRDR